MTQFLPNYYKVDRSTQGSQNPKWIPMTEEGYLLLDVRDKLKTLDYQQINLW